MTELAERRFDALDARDPRGLATYACELAVVGLVYFALAKVGAIIPALHADALPISVLSGAALAAVLLRGVRIWPAILAAAGLAAAFTDTGEASIVVSTAIVTGIAVGHTLSPVLGGYLVNLWAGGRNSFETPGNVAKFALLTAGPGSLIGALVGAGTLSAPFADWGHAAALCASWWLREAAGALVVTPAIVLWASRGLRGFDRDSALETIAVVMAAIAVGLAAFSPLFEQTAGRSALAFLAILPLLWAALRCDQRATATVALLLAGFAAWGAVAGGGPFAGRHAHEMLLLLTVFMTSAAVAALAFSADTAVRNRVEVKLRQQELVLRNMFSQAVVGVAQVDPTGRFNLVNHRFGDLVRRPIHELLQLRLHDLIDPDDQRYLSDLFAHAVSTGEGFVIETRAMLPDGSRTWLHANMSPIFDGGGAVHQLVLVAEDVAARRAADETLQKAHDELQHTVYERTTALKKAHEVLHTEIQQRKRVETALKNDIAERRKAQEALMESEWRFRLVIQGVTDYAIFMLDREGRVTNWNTGAQRIHQYTATEAIGEHYSRFFSDEEQQRGEPARALQVAAYEGKYVVEGWRLRRDESRFWASVVIEAIRDDAGDLVGFVKITRDISERREAQASLERAQEQLAQSQKMEALGQLTGSIAHDFNNLLMIVSGHAQLLRRRLGDGKHLQAIDAINSAANRGESLTRQLLAFSRRQPINPVVTDLKERVEAVHEMLVGSLRGNVALKCDIAPDVWAIEVDVAEFELALVNIAVNARDAMPGGGTLTLSARNVTLKKSDAADQLEGEYVALAMTDTGVGIAPDVLPKIFEPFFTTKALGKGTGLGLAQVYGFSKQSGGTVVATSTAGSGTAITIYLPRRQAVAVKTAEALPAQPIVPGQGTVLVVEDNAEVAAVTASLVEQLGYRTLRAENAIAALNALQRGDEISLVFSDVVMPGSMNGIALAQAIGSRYPRIPVLLTSGYSDVVQSVGSPFPILRKPFQLAALEKAIREALERPTAPDQDGDDGRVLQFPRWRGTAVRE